LLSLNRILTITLAIVAIIAISLTVYIVEENAVNSYSSEISYQITKLPVVFDYSCDTNDTQINVVLTNQGTKAVTDFTVSVTNPACVGAIPSLPSIFKQSSTMNFTVLSSSINGTINIAGNYTLVSINF
jgi:molybdopterin biosynthesis enzyme MoaB